MYFQYLSLNSASFFQFWIFLVLAFPAKLVVIFENEIILVVTLSVQI